MQEVRDLMEAHINRELRKLVEHIDAMMMRGINTNVHTPTEVRVTMGLEPVITPEQKSLLHVRSRLAEAVSQANAAAMSWKLGDSRWKYLDDANSLLQRRPFERHGMQIHPRIQDIELLIIRLKGRDVSHRIKCPLCLDGEPSMWIKDDQTTFCFHCGVQPSLEELGAKLRTVGFIASSDPVIVALIWRLDLPASTMTDTKL